MTNTPQPSVAIIGGGYTGMVAALRLAQAGVSVSLWERAPHLGGLASDFTLNGTSLEKAYHHIFKSDTSIINLANELGVGDALEWRESRTALVYDRVVYPFATPLDLLKFSPLPFAARIRTGAISLFLQKFTNWHALREQTALEWMRRWAGPESTAVIWEPLLRGKFHHFFDKVSMGWLWARLHVRANSRDGGNDERLGYFAGGFAVFTEALEERLRALGVEIHTDAVIDSVTESTESGYTLTVGRKKKKYDAVLLTTPASVFNSLTASVKAVRTDYREKLASIPYLDARVMIFSSTQNLSEYYWHNINDLDVPFLVFINHTSLIPRENYRGEYVYYIATYAASDDPNITMTDKKLTNSWFAGLAGIFPNFDKAAVTSTTVFTLRNAQHVVDTDYHNRIPDYETGANGLYLANFTQIYPEDRGTNYAVREGEKIAGRVQDYLISRWSQ